MKETDEMHIEFYTPKYQVIPLDLRLKVNGKDVFYRRVYGFGNIVYNFEVFDSDEQEALDIVKKIADKMCWQSYDHGVQWRIVSIHVLEKLDPNIRYPIFDTIQVIFRVRDAG